MKLPTSNKKQMQKKSSLGVLATSSSMSKAAARSYTFATGRGNFPNHVIEALKARRNWKQLSEEVAITECNFYWRQLNFSFREYDALDERLETSPGKPIFVNHLENNRGICTKTGLIRSL